MTDLRRYRLLLLAGKPANHKRWYSQYRQLQDEGLTGWAVGWAYRTESGDKWLIEYEEGRV